MRSRPIRTSCRVRSSSWSSEASNTIDADGSTKAPVAVVNCLVAGACRLPGRCASMNAARSARVSSTSNDVSATASATLIARGIGRRAEQRHAVTIEPLHPREVGWGLRLARQDRVDEVRPGLGGQRQRAVEAALVADGGPRHRPQGLAACAAGPMPRPDLHEVRPGRHQTQRGLQLLGRWTHRSRPAPAADSSRSGRPTSPTKRKSPLATPIGMSAPLPRSVTTKTMCSGVCPGVCRTSTSIEPTLKWSPSPTSV